LRDGDAFDMGSKINNRWKIILIATLFNLLAEYSLRGINNLEMIPQLSLALFLSYFPYLAMMEDLIGRYRLKDYHVFVAALFFGLLWQLIGPSGALLSPLLLGINWITVIFVNLFWWCPIQTILALYIGNRTAPRQEWDRPLLSEVGWGLAFLTFVGITLLLRVLVKFPPLTMLQLLIMAGLMVATLVLFYRIHPGPRERSLAPAAFGRDRFLDFLSASLIVYLLYSAVFLASQPAHVVAAQLNLTALQAGVVVSTIVTLLMLARRLSSRKPIPV
jgi:hypothetical protein